MFFVLLSQILFRDNEFSMRFFIFSLAPILLLLNFFNISIEKDPRYNNIELFDSSLLHLNSIQKLIDYADSSADKQHIKVGSLQYGILASYIIKNRFYHGFSVYNFRQNWIAAISQYLIGKGLASPVNPGDILKYPFAGCSQQAIVLMGIMKTKKISYRSVGFPHHYAVELNFNNEWYYFDPDMEPKINEKERLENNWNKSADSLKRYYPLSLNHLDWGFGTSQLVKVGKINADPAPNASIFQSVSKFLSKTLWIFPLFFTVYPRKRV